MKRVIKIAIDGPAAAGKSTVAKKIAQALDYMYIDTGAMYRALTFRALQTNTPVDQESELVHILKKMSIKFKQIGDEQHVILDGVDVTKDIREPEVTKHVSAVAKHEQIRELMVKHQQQLANQDGVVMDGRDIGTYVLPDAEVKIFLVASVTERAIRRHQENVSRGFPSDLELIKQEIIDRDLTDENRSVSPLVKAPDAIEINTTDLTSDEVVDKIIQIASSRLTIKNNGE
ncbi:MAG TPA: (d)CMP kinase [Bacillota bacterium]|nr:(d)CMP kinase [Bacillota bacterium]